MVVDVTNDGEQGYLFKGDDYYKYTLGTYGFTKVEGPSPIGADFPGLSFRGIKDRVFLFQKRGSGVSVG
jgi:hypothetical protein